MRSSKAMSTPSSPGLTASTEKRCTPAARVLTSFVALLFIVALPVGCRSKPITSGSLEDTDRAKVFAAARAVLKKRFGTFSVVDEKAGRLVTSPKMPDVRSTSRFLAQVEVSEDDPPQIEIEVVVEVLSFQDSRVIWTRYRRDDAQKKVEGYILEEIRARLEDREPNLPNLDDLEPPPVEHQVPKSPPAKKDRPLTPGQAPALPKK